MPFGLVYPASYKEQIIVTLPTSWKVTESEEHLKNACFAYNYRFYCVGNHVYLDADYENYKSYTSMEESSDYFKDLGKYDDFASFELSSGKSDVVKQSNSNASNKNLLSTLLVVGVIIGGLIWWSQKR